MHQVALRLAFTLLFAPVPLFAQVAWVPKLDQALKLAQERNQFVIIDVGASWCPPCIQMEREVFSDPRFAEFSRNQVFMHVDAERDAEGVRLASRFQVHNFPTILVLDAKGDEIHRLIGGRSTRGLIDDLEKIFANPRKIKEIVEQASQNRDDFGAQYLAGSRLFDRRENGKALPFLRRAAELAQEDRSRIDILVMLSDASLEDRKYEETLKSIEQLEKLVSSAGTEPALVERKARALIGLRRYDECVATINLLLQKTSGTERERARNLLAELPGKYRKADEQVTKNLAKVEKALRDDKVEEAYALASEVTETAPSSAPAHFLLAGALFKKAEKESDQVRKGTLQTSGLDHLRLSRRLDPDNLDLWMRTKGALASDSFKLVPSGPETAKVYAKAETAFAEKKFKDAAELYQKTIDLEPAFAAAYRNLGDCHFGAGSYEVALQCYRTAIQKAPLDPVSYRFAADVYRRLRRREESRQQLVASLMADPDYPLVWTDLTTLAESEGKRVERRAGMIPSTFLMIGSDPGSYNEAIFSAVPAATVPAWQAYLKTKLLWRQEKFRQKHPRSAFYYTTAEEEVQCLTALLDVWDQLREDDQSLRDSNLDLLLELKQDGLLRAFVFFELFTEEYRAEFEAWKRDNVLEAHEYVGRYVLEVPGAEEEDDETARSVSVDPTSKSDTASVTSGAQDDPLAEAAQLLVDEEAKQAVRLLIRIFPSLKDTNHRDRAMLMLGMGYYQLEDWAEARKWFSTYLLRNPAHAEAREAVEEIDAKLRAREE